MGNGIDPNIYVGMEYGIYTIDCVMPNRDKWNHIVYKGTCKECGYEKFAPIGDFKNKNPQKCNHFGLLTQEKKDVWYEKNKKKCPYCENYIPLGDMYFSDYKKLKFCSKSCAASYHNMHNEKVYAKRKESLQFDIIIDDCGNEIKVPSKNYCKNCNKEIKQDKQFCSQECFNEFKYKEYIRKWKNGLVDGLSGYAVSKTIRKYLFEKYNNMCAQCGWGEKNPTTGKVPLEVHHQDGDYTNNTEDNLILLCPNCHALTPTYKAINKGNGRKDRKKYYLN